MYSLTREWCTGIEVCTQFSPFIELETFFPEQALQTYIEGCKLSLILPVLAVADATYWFQVHAACQRQSCKGCNKYIFNLHVKDGLECYIKSEKKGERSWITPQVYTFIIAIEFWLRRSSAISSNIEEILSCDIS